MAERLSTGVGPLDRAIGGGLPPGHVVVLQTPPESQGELLLKEFTHAQDTLFLSTTRTADAVRDWLDVSAEWTFGDESGIDIRSIDLNTPIRGIDAAAKAVDDQAYVVVDPVFPLEVGDLQPYLTLLRDLRNHLQNTESVAVLHMVESGAPPEHRWLTLQMADTVLRVSIEDDTDEVTFHLAVTKSRNEQLPEEKLKVELGDRVAVDTSRDIA